MGMEANENFINTAYRRALFPNMLSILGGTVNILADGILDETRTVSVVMNPDTSDEETISATVAKGTGVSFVRREGYNTFYLDRDCTKIYKDGTADKNEDLTLYCIPDREPVPFTAEQAEEINTVDNLLKSYQTITYAQLDYIGGYTMHVMHFLNEADEVCSIEDDSGYSAYRNSAFLFESENGETYYHIYGEAERTPHLLMVANSEFTSQTTNENGDLLWDYSEAEKATVTVTLADGSTRTAQIPKGECFTWSCDEGYALYADADGKTALGETSEPVEADMTLYVLKSNA